MEVSQCPQDNNVPLGVGSAERGHACVTVESSSNAMLQQRLTSWFASSCYGRPSRSGIHRSVSLL